jgi:5-methylthioadenosine/S-adenosylhomocysteine deaminase
VMSLNADVTEDPEQAPGPALISGGWLLTMDSRSGDFHPGDILVERGRIVAIGKEIKAEGAARIDASNCIVLPGLIDTHRHTWQSMLRHCMGDADFHGYRKAILGRVGPLVSPEDIYIGTLIGAISALEAGTTTLLDWSHALNTPAHADAAIAALRTTGIRAIFAYGYPRLEAQSWTVASNRPHPRDIIRVRRDVLHSDDQLVTLAMAARGPEMTRMEIVRGDFALARELGVRISMHVGTLGGGPRFHAIEQLHEAGLLGPDLTLIHLCDSSERELTLIAEHGVSASLGVQCEMSIPGVGVPATGRLMAAGIRPSLSGDTETCGSGDLFTQMRLALACERVLGTLRIDTAQTPPLKVRDVLEFATIAGAAASGLESRVGSLSAGKDADLILVRSTDLNLMPLNDPVGALVLAAHPGNVDTVMVRGRILKRGGRMVGLDVARIHQQACESRDRLLNAATGICSKGHACAVAER